MSPMTNDGPTSAYAESGIAPMSVSPDSEANISLIMGAASGEFNPADTTATTVTADEVTFRPYKFQVRYAQTSQYAVQLSSMNGYGNELHGRDNPTTLIAGVGENVSPADFGNNTWGFALVRNSVNGDTAEDGLASADYTQYKYSTVPKNSAQTGQNTKIVDTPVNPDNNQTEAQADDWTLAFAAKIGSDSPADHYIARVHLSVVRTPGRVYTVTYNANKPADAASDTEVTGLPDITKLLDNGANSIYELSKNNLKLKKYTFLGWSTKKLAAFSKTDRDNAKAAVQYKAGDNIDLANFTVNQADINLYAVWIEGSNLLDINTMQEMSVAVCNSDDTKIGDTKRLEDTRDRKDGIVGTGTYYWVAKLADGNCWMTQNLDFDIPSDGTLDPAKSNIPSTFTKISGTIYRFDNDSGTNSWNTHSNYNYNKISYYDPGLMLKTNPATTERCENVSLTLNQADCTSKGWKDVSNGYNVNETPVTVATTNTQNTSKTSNVFNETAKTYDAHYLSGNYYSYTAATAGYGKTSTFSTDGDKIDYSICPKGWRLPLSGPSNDAENGSFYKLLNIYGVASDPEPDTTHRIYDAPLYWLRAGVTGGNPNYNGGLWDAGSRGYYWSSIVASGTNAYGFYFNSGTYIDPSVRYLRYGGMAIRCVHDPSIAEAD